MAEEDSQLVPLVKLGSREFLVDIENRQFIDNDDVSRCIDMHSARGRAMVDEMEGTEWRCFTLYPGRDDGGLEV